MAFHGLVRFRENSLSNYRSLYLFVLVGSILFCEIDIVEAGVAGNISNSSITPNNTNLTSANLTSANLVNAKYTNHTSNAYQIQFSYPKEWQVEEKTGRFDEGTDLTIRNLGSTTAFILIQRADDPIADIGSKDFRTGLYQAFKDTLTGDYENEIRVIEQPSFTTIDGNTAGTFLYTTKDKYEDNAWTWGTQNWVVYVGDHAYLIMFTERTDLFDSPENTEIRDHFIKSINFLGNTTASNVTNRFG